MIDGVPRGYKLTPEIQSVERPCSTLPTHFEYTESYAYTLRCHLYQARSLLAADSNGASDPFARVLFWGYSAITQTIEKTRNPFWDETLEIVMLTGCSVLPSDLVLGPPTVVIEVFDRDRFVSNCAHT